jgi:hypothetical protein
MRGTGFDLSGLIVVVFQKSSQAEQAAEKIKTLSF